AGCVNCACPDLRGAGSSNRPVYPTSTIEKHTAAVLDAAERICDSSFKSRNWFHNEPVDAFDYQTADQLVAAGRTESLCRYLQSIDAGWLG
ncbi:MAG: hypothetical protein SCI24_20105, partial [Halomonas sp.]|nr:hypothetical protein [Halomonas sp.]